MKESNIRWVLIGIIVALMITTAWLYQSTQDQVNSYKEWVGEVNGWYSDLQNRTSETLTAYNETISNLINQITILNERIAELEG